MPPTKTEEGKDLKNKDALFLMHMVYNLTTNGAKVDWKAMAQATNYKSGPSANVAFSRIKARLQWPAEGAGPPLFEPVADRAKRGAEHMEPTGKRPPTKRSKGKTVQDEAADTGDDNEEMLKREPNDDDEKTSKRKHKDDNEQLVKKEMKNDEKQRIKYEPTDDDEENMSEVEDNVAETPEG